MKHRDAILGMFALLALASVAPRGRRRDDAPSARPAPQPRPMPRADAPVPFRGEAPMGSTVWVLVQTMPTLQVLATAATRRRLEIEAAELVAVLGEAREARTFAFAILPANHLF